MLAGSTKWVVCCKCEIAARGASPYVFTSNAHCTEWQAPLIGGEAATESVMANTDSDNGTKESPALSVWVLTDGKIGDDVQCLAVAEGLGRAFAKKIVAPRPPWAWAAPWGGVDPITALVCDPRHPDHGTSLTDRVVWIESTVGSSSSSSPRDTRS